MSDAIKHFTGENRWLSNFYPSKINIDGDEYATVEHYFQSQKPLDFVIADGIRHAPTATIAKILGRKCELRDDWRTIRFNIMETGLRAKFKLPEFKSRLIDTGIRDISEVCVWGNNIWGYDEHGFGENNLGMLLMEIREDISPQLVFSDSATPCCGGVALGVNQRWWCDTCKSRVVWSY